MARPLRMERAGAWYHVTARGTERRVIFADDRDRRRWMELVAEAVAVYTFYGISLAKYEWVSWPSRCELSRIECWITSRRAAMSVGMFSAMTGTGIWCCVWGGRFAE